jgi:glycerol-3-phosphate dehydrogenase subunit B
VLPQPLGRDFARIGHEWASVDRALPAPDGTLRAFEHAAAAQADARCQQGALVCGFTGLGAFRADVLARLWGDSLGMELHAGALTLDDTPPAGWSPASLAARLDRKHEDVARELAALVRSTHATAVVMPAVLGFESAPELCATLARSCGVPVGEALAAAPSLPGWRLQSALDRLLGRAGVLVETGKVVDRRVEDSRVQGIVLRSAGGAPRELSAAAFVLATGKFVGGGIDARAELLEPALNIPVWLDHLGERFDRNEPLTLTNAERLDDQPLLGVGVKVNAEQQPLGPGDAVLYENVRVAGAVRAGYEPGKHGLGAAAVEGWSAGERAAP